MIHYDELYQILFQSITDAIYSIKEQDYSFALYLLIKAQQDAGENQMNSKAKALTRMCKGSDCVGSRRLPILPGRFQPSTFGV